MLEEMINSLELMVSGDGQPEVTPTTKPSWRSRYTVQSRWDGDVETMLAPLALRLRDIMNSHIKADIEDISVGIFCPF